MDKLNQLLNGDVFDFAAAFGASARESFDDPASPGCPVWLGDGWRRRAPDMRLVTGSSYIKGSPATFISQVYLYGTARERGYPQLE
jgi:hypothetical protein